MATKTLTQKTSRRHQALRGLGILGLLGIGAAHLELWLGYYHMIPTIGPLFLFVVVFSWALALVTAVRPYALVAVVAAGFALATLGGYVLALVLPQGIFLFTEPYISYAGGVAIASEFIGGLALLAWAATRVLGGHGSRQPAPFGTEATRPRGRQPEMAGASAGSPRSESERAAAAAAPKAWALPEYPRTRRGPGR